MAERPKAMRLVFEDDFRGPRLDPSVWLPHYLPAWSSRAATAATYHMQDPVSISRSHRIKDCGAPTTIRRRCECLESNPATSPGQWAAPWGSGVPSWSHRTRGTRAFRRLDPGSRLGRAAGTRRHHSAVDGGVLGGRAGGSAGAVRGDLCRRNFGNTMEPGNRPWSAWDYTRSGTRQYGKTFMPFGCPSMWHSSTVTQSTRRSIRPPSTWTEQRYAVVLGRRRIRCK
jgi:hypothetical protein